VYIVHEIMRLHRAFQNVTVLFPPFLGEPFGPLWVRIQSGSGNTARSYKMAGSLFQTKYFRIEHWKFCYWKPAYLFKKLDFLYIVSLRVTPLWENLSVQRISVKHIGVAQQESPPERLEPRTNLATGRRANSLYLCSE
jgi:hypothetical protein